MFCETIVFDSVENIVRFLSLVIPQTFESYTDYIFKYVTNVELQARYLVILLY